MKQENDQILLDLATVSRHGLIFKDHVYSNGVMLKNRWFELAEEQGGWQVPILFMPSNMDHIILIHFVDIDIALRMDEKKTLDPDALQAYYEKLNLLKDHFTSRKNRQFLND